MEKQRLTSLRALRRSFTLLLYLVAVGASAEIPNAVYQPPTDISADDRQATLDQLDRFVEKLKQIEAEIDRSQFDLPALLDRLAFDEKMISEFVRDEIGFEQYAGLLRGAQGTLISGAGNALDQSILLATLLKDAGLEARIVRGRLSTEQARQLLSGIGKRAGDTGQQASKTKAWDARLAELREISGAPVPLKYPPLEEAPFYAATQRTTNELIKALRDADISLARQDANSLGTEAMDYFWVESRLGPDKQWQVHHPAFGTPIELSVKAVETFADQVPESLQHRLKIEVFIEQKLGKKLKITRVAGPWVRPVANLNGVVLSYFNHPNTLDLQSIRTGVGAAVAKARLFIPVLNGKKGTAFDLNGSTIDVDALNMDSFGAAAVIQTVSDQARKATNALAAIGTADDSKKEDLMTLSRHWIEYTLIKPGGEETTYQRVLMDRLGEVNRKSGKIRLRQMSQDDIRRALTVRHRFMVATGSYSDAYTTQQVVQRLIDSAPAWRQMIDYLYGGVVQLSGIKGLKPSPLPQLALYRTFDLGPEKMGAPIAYRASPSLIVLRDGLLPEKRGFHSVDVVTNKRRVLVRGKNNRLQFNAEKAVAIGVWETAIETMAHDYFVPGSGKNNTFAVFDAAQQQGIKARVLGPKTADASRVGLNDDALTNLIRDLEAGNAVLIPEQVPSGLGLTGWWRVNPVSGTTLGMTSDGRGGVATEYLLLLLENAVTLIGSLANYAKCEKYEEVEKVCCLVEAHMKNVGGLGMGGVLASSLGRAGPFCSAGSMIRDQIKNMSSPKKEWSCHFFDGNPDDMIGPGGITGPGNCGISSELVM
ncbi:MAG: hypothetical protein BMS9Abin08_1243 [Gammaproteobacteria bacterium]|nr:MAG: hypothetical protein BMS9Abin08_1243 [Gammaproteobacteria bacterium]